MNEGNGDAVVHIVDDDDNLRGALSSLFRSVGLAVETYGSVDLFREAAPSGGPACLVCDVRMPGTSGLEFLRGEGSAAPQFPVVLMTGHGDIPMGVKAMKSGAVDFLSKPFREQDMLDAVAAAIQRHRSELEERAKVSEVLARFAILTPRERQVMELVTAGRLNKQVAGDLGLSEITVKIHRASAMRKMQARTLPDLVRMSETVKAAAKP